MRQHWSPCSGSDRMNVWSLVAKNQFLDLIVRRYLSAISWLSDWLLTVIRILYSEAKPCYTKCYAKLYISYNCKTGTTYRASVSENKDFDNAFSHWTNNILHLHPSIFSSMAQHSPHHRGFTFTLKDTPYSVGLPWTNDHPTAETSTWQHITLTSERHPCPQRDSNPQSKQSSGRRSTP